MVLYFSHLMYKYYSHLGFSPIKHDWEGKDVHNEIFNNIPHFIKNRLRVYFIQDSFVLCNNKVILLQIEVIHPIPGYMISVYLCKNIYP